MVSDDLAYSFCFSIVAIMTWRIQTTVQGSKDVDWNYGLYITALQSQLEIWLGIIAANLPTLAPLTSQLLMPKIKIYFGWDGSKELSKVGRLTSRIISGGNSTLKQDKLTLLADEDLHLELGELRHSSKIEVGTTSRSVGTDARSWDTTKGNGIGIRHDVDFSVEIFNQTEKKTHM